MRVLPVTPERWDDMDALFSSKGAPHYCWCMVYRDARHPEMTKAQRRAAMRGLVKRGTPVGVLAYDTSARARAAYRDRTGRDGDEPVGWCSVAPRETYPRLERSRVMPRVDDRATWTVLCFFVKRDHREQGAMLALLKGAVKHAKAGGAEVVEAYPWDTSGVSSTHRGHSSVFEKAGFRQEGGRWVRSTRRSARASRRPDDSPRAPSSRGAARRPKPRSR